MKKKLRAIVEDSHFFYLKTLLFYEKNIPKNKTLFLGIKSGAGEIRTPVQTSNNRAFFMFSFQLNFRPIAG